MLKQDIKDLKLTGQILSYGYLNTTIRLKDGSVIKLFKPEILSQLKDKQYDIEEKIINSEKTTHSKEIVTPTSLVYYPNGAFAGYTVPYIKGISYNERDESLTKKDQENLKMFAQNHKKLEKILKENPNIVFPDFCTCDNIIIEKSGEIKLIDYDGLQVDNYKSHAFSTTLGTISEHTTDKYMTNSGLFTKELDKKSSIYLYFLSAFNVNLAKVGTINPISGKIITLQDIFVGINLEDPELCHKVWKLFQDNKENEYLDDTIFDIADKYNLKIINQYGKNYHKRLSKKK